MTMIEITKPQKEYELIDSGEGEKLERFGLYTLRRPDPQALWNKTLGEEEWKRADAFYVRSGTKGQWQFKKDTPKEWQIKFAELVLTISPTPFKHTGLFPEQLSNWQWMENLVKSHKLETGTEKTIKVLNLFGYTGGASLVCARAGAEVVHVDASKTAIGWGRENAKLSGLEDAPIRWMLDDVSEFVKREIKRGNTYDGILLDPPAFGHGPNGESWKIEENFLSLLDSCKKLLAEQPLFFLINGYSSGYSALAYQNNLLDFKDKYGGVLEEGELAIEESKTGRLLPSGIFARWARF